MSEEGLKETNHNKIFIGIPGEFKLSDVKQWISELIKVSKENNNDELKNILKRIVPTYKVEN